MFVPDCNQLRFCILIKFQVIKMDISKSQKKRTLIVKHLPSKLPDSDKAELLKTFGAEEVRLVGLKNDCPKHTCFALFPTEAVAWEALQSLHQVEVLGCRLSVEFSKKDFYNSKVSKSDSSQEDDKEEYKRKTLPKEDDDASVKASRKLNSISEKWKVTYSFNQNLKYKYPLPNPVILSNISNALVSVPSFYTQVLHLMNKMNLPPPFGPQTLTPPLEAFVNMEKKTEIETVEMEEESEEESELETDDEGQVKTAQPKPFKRRKVEKKRKKHDIKALLNPSVAASKSQSLKPEEVFDQADITVPKKIDLRITQGATALEKDKMTPSGHEASDIFEARKSEDGDMSGGFGKIKPQVKIQEDSSESESDSDTVETFISRRRLEKGCLTSSEMKAESVFRKYDSGEPAKRLYVKNVAKQSTEKDLRYVFGRYVNWEDETEKQMFDIRLMKKGRMKGQAFVTLGSEESAKKAVKETNAYVLNGKPIVVQFARSAQAKDSA